MRQEPRCAVCGVLLQGEVCPNGHQPEAPVWRSTAAWSATTVTGSLRRDEPPSSTPAGLFECRHCECLVEAHERGGRRYAPRYCPWCGGELSSLVGRELLGYRIDTVIGQGGFAAVYLASNLAEPEIKSVVKFLRPEVADRNPFLRRLFVEEARVTERIGRECWNVVRVFNVRDEPWPHYFMEYVRGRTLDRYITRLGEHPMPLEAAKGYLRGIATALEATHSRDRLHRDLKPLNIMVTRGTKKAPRAGRIKLLDFGLTMPIEQHRSGDEDGDAPPLPVAGTPGYMAPEAYDGHNTPAGDVYSFGVTAYEVLTGQRPWKEPTNGAHFFHWRDVQKSTPPRPLRELRPDVPAWLAKVVMECLHREPSRRPTAKALLERLKDPLPRWVWFASAAAVAVVAFFVWSYLKPERIGPWNVPQRRLIAGHVVYFVETEAFRFIPFEQNTQRQLDHLVLPVDDVGEDELAELLAKGSNSDREHRKPGKHRLAIPIPIEQRTGVWSLDLVPQETSWPWRKGQNKTDRVKLPPAITETDIEAISLRYGSGDKRYDENPKRVRTFAEENTPTQDLEVTFHLEVVGDERRIHSASCNGKAPTEMTRTRIVFALKLPVNRDKELAFSFTGWHDLDVFNMVLVVHPDASAPKPKYSLVSNGQSTCHRVASSREITLHAECECDDLDHLRIWIGPATGDPLEIKSGEDLGGLYLGEGNYQLSLQAVDTTGHSSKPEPKDLVIDTGPPSLSVLEGSEYVEIKSATMPLRPKDGILSFKVTDGNGIPWDKTRFEIRRDDGTLVSKSPKVISQTSDCLVFEIEFTKESLWQSWSGSISFFIHDQCERLFQETYRVQMEEDIDWPECTHWMGVDWVLVRRRGHSPFYISRHEVSNELFQEFCDKAKPLHPGDPRHPVVGIDPADAERFAAVFQARLPTLEEWCQAARDHRSAEQWVHCRATRNRPKNYVDVDYKPPDDQSSWSLYHMLGNVGELVKLRDGRYATVGGSSKDSRDKIDMKPTPYFPKDPMVGFRMVIDVSDPSGVPRFMEEAIINGDGCQ